MEQLNEVTKYEGHHVSYLPEQDEVSLMLGSLLGFDTTKDETALVVGTEFYILSGDWREEYSKVSTLEERLQIFIDNMKEHISPWSTGEIGSGSVDKNKLM